VATTTYEPIATTTLGSNQSSVSFSSFAGYTDLIIVINGSTTGSCDLKWQANSDTGSNYSGTRMTGSGSAAFSSRFTSDTGAAFGWSNTSPSVNILQIQNYANTTTFKTSLGRPSNSNALVGAYVGLYRSTSAITSLSLMNTDGASFTSGTTFTLYGIANADIGAKATGGVITYDDTYYYHTFVASGTFTPKQSLTADVLVVGGGGGGGSDVGAGGGGGEVDTFSSNSQNLTTTGYTVTVGGGGAGSTSGSNRGTNGGTSTFAGVSTITALGGGGGASGSNTSGLAGGSGGGARSGTPGSASGSNTFAGGQGNDSGNFYTGGGGGGASAVGTAGSTAGSFAQGGNGGQGLTISSISSGLPFIGPFTGMTRISSGGGGSALNVGGSAAGRGLGGDGGGNGGQNFNTTVVFQGTSATSFGSGGGGSAWQPNLTAGNGYSGIVIVRYLK
jgi:hypothetical protein